MQSFIENYMLLVKQLLLQQIPVRYNSNLQVNFLCGHLFCQAKFNLELEKLRIELRHAQGLHAVAQSEKIEASRKVISVFLSPETLSSI